MNPKTLPSRTTLTRARELYLATVAAGEVPDVADVPCVCKAPRLEHAGPTHAGGTASTGCVRYREDQLLGMVARAHAARDHGFADTMRVYDRISRTKATRKAPGEVSVRPSDVYGCRHQVQLRENPPEDLYRSETDKRAAWMGGIIHDELGRRRKLAYPWRMFEQPVRLPGSDREYRYDEYDPLTATLYEYKTAGDWRWEKVGEGLPGWDKKWLAQGMVYARSLREQGWPVDRVVIVVLRRENGEDEEFGYDYDEAVAVEALDWIADVALHIENDLELPRDELGPETSIMCAKLCEFRDYCWSIPQAEATGHTPESLTFLLTSPEEAEIVAQLDELVTLAESRLHIERQEKALKAKLKNLLIRPYGGEFLPVPGGTSSTDYTSWAEEVRLWAALPPWVRAEQMPEPKTRKSRYYRWKRERLAVKERRRTARKKAVAAAGKELDAALQPAAS